MSDITEEKTRILILEDHQPDVELAVRALQREGADICWKHARCKSEFEEGLRTFQPDLVLSDFRLSDMDGMEAIAMVTESLPGTPIVMYTGSINEETAVECLKAGASDYVLKGKLARLPLACAAAMENASERAERRRAETALRESEKRYRVLVETGNDAIVSANAEGEIVSWNASAEAMFGYTVQEARGMSPLALMPERYRADHEAAYSARAGTGLTMDASVTMEAVGLRKDGTEFPLEISLAAWKRGEALLFNTIIRDISERKSAEDAIEWLSSQHELLLNSAGGGIFGVDSSGVGIFVNPTALRLSGRTRDEVLGANVHEVLQPTDSKGSPLSIEDSPVFSVLRGGTPSRGETFFLRKDGQFFPVAFSATPVLKSGELTGAVVIFEDISERRDAEEALRTSEAKYRDLVEEAAHGIYRSTVEGRFQSANPAMVEMLGYDSPEDLLRLDPSRDLYLDSASRNKALEALARADRIDGLETKWKRRDGTPILVRLGGRPIRDEKGEVDHIEMIAEDITDQRAIEDQLRQAQKMEAVGQLTGGIAHDFNNELSVIQLNAELVALGLDSGGAVDPADLKAILDAAKRAARIIRHLLSFSRQAELRMAPTDLSAVAQGLTDMLRMLLPESINLHFDLPAEVNSVTVDEGAVEQIVMNLATNARDAMPEGGDLNIKVSEIELDEESCLSHAGSRPGRFVCIEVRDDGIGMGPETRERALDPFFTTKPTGEGTGLGLSMVSGLAQQQGGFVTLSSEPGRGTTVRVYFPLSAEEPEQGTPAPAQVAMPGGDETILLVEDEPGVRKAAKNALERSGYRVLTAVDGEDGLEMFRENQEDIDLVISDVVMPKLGGAGMHRQMKEMVADLPFILASGYTGGGGTERDRIDPSVPFVQKPWNLQHLLVTVRSVLDGEV